MIQLLQVAWEVLTVHRHLKKKGFGDTVKLYGRYKDSAKPKRSMGTEQAKRLLRRIDRICFLFWGDAECLHRSLIGFKLLRLGGVDVDSVVGVRKFPFRSHAWLERQGRIVNDSDEIRKTYQEILRGGGGEDK